MTSTGWVILIGYTALCVVGISVALVVFRSTRVGFHAEPAGREKLERNESFWGIAVGVFLVTLLALTIFQVPYFKDEDAKARQQVDIIGQQYAWTIDPPRVKAGIQTAFDVHSKDVNHAVGIYNPNDTLIKQVNSFPGSTQRFVLTFKRPGKYKLRCLEFCGLGHHKMESTLEVTR